MKLPRILAFIAVLSLFLKPFGSVAGAEPAGGAPKNVVTQAQANPVVLPQRNLQIEIRQIGNDAVQRSSVDAQGRVILQPGSSRSEGVVGIDQSRSNQSRSLQQQALVLNGRSVSFTLGQTLPLRVVQVLIYKDVVNFVPSAVLIDRNSGFTARPLWYGDDVAEVEISTMLAQGAKQSKVSTTLPIQMNEWITIAQTEESQISSTSGILSRSNQQGQISLRVDIRVTVK
ncbi:MAG: hypothetical protein EAZ37_14550 [Burkholderiales bacterium]|nr:MAG: hypothetical protein EAZ37_14550 [Burkholderiales bacterium]